MDLKSVIKAVIFAITIFCLTHSLRHLAIAFYALFWLWVYPNPSQLKELEETLVPNRTREFMNTSDFLTIALSDPKILLMDETLLSFVLWAFMESLFHAIWAYQSILALYAMYMQSKMAFKILKVSQVILIVSYTMITLIIWPELWDSNGFMDRLVQCLISTTDVINCFFRHDVYEGPIKDYLPVDFVDIRVTNLVTICIWIVIYSLMPWERKIVLKEKKKVRIKDYIHRSWIQHCCLYGHKDLVKRIIDKFKTDVNEQVFNGNTLMHLAVFGGNQNVVQILISKFCSKINLSLRNEDGLDVIDLAIQKKNHFITKMLLKHIKHRKPHISNLIMAIETNQHELVSIISQKLSSYLSKTPDISIQIERFIELSKEIEMKTTTEERKEVCNNNLAIYKKHICSVLKEISKEDIENEQSSSVEETKTSRDIMSEFECPICFEIMKSPRRIYSCSNDHYICSLCLTDKLLKSCPQCREDFEEIKPTIRHTSERLLSKILGSIF